MPSFIAARTLVLFLTSAAADRGNDYRDAMSALFASKPIEAGPTVAPTPQPTSQVAVKVGHEEATTVTLDLYSNGEDGKLYANGAPFAIKVCTLAPQLPC